MKKTIFKILKYLFIAIGAMFSLAIITTFKYSSLSDNIPIIILFVLIPFGLAYVFHKKYINVVLRENPNFYKEKAENEKSIRKQKEEYEEEKKINKESKKVETNFHNSKKKNSICRKIFTSIALIIIIFAGFIAIIDIMDTHVSSVTNSKSYDVSITDATLNEISLYITGTLTNNTNKDKRYVQVLIPVYDINGNKLGNAIANINNLGAGQTWNFKALYAGNVEQVATYETSNIQVDGF